MSLSFWAPLKQRGLITLNRAERWHSAMDKEILFRPPNAAMSRFSSKTCPTDNYECTQKKLHSWNSIRSGMAGTSWFLTDRETIPDESYSIGFLLWWCLISPLTDTEMRQKKPMQPEFRQKSQCLTPLSCTLFNRPQICVTFFSRTGEIINKISEFILTPSHSFSLWYRTFICFHSFSIFRSCDTVQHLSHQSWHF
jgi:hypothetical protein